MHVNLHKQIILAFIRGIKSFLSFNTWTVQKTNHSSFIYIFLRVTLQYGGLEILIIYLELNHFFFLEKI